MTSQNEYAFHGTRGLMQFLASDNWLTYSDRDLLTLLNHVGASIGEEKALINHYDVKRLIEKALLSENEGTLSCAFSVASMRTDVRTLVVKMLFADMFPVLAKRRVGEIVELINEDAARQLLAEAKVAPVAKQWTLLDNLKIVGSFANINGLPQTNVSVESLTKRLMVDDEMLLPGLLQQLGFNDLDVHIACSNSNLVSTSSRLSKELSRIADELRRADAKSAEKFLYQKRDIRNLVTDAITVVCLEQGGSGAALAYLFRKATGLMVKVLFAGDDELSGGTKMLLLDPLESAQTEEIAAELTDLIKNGKLLQLEIARDFGLGFNAYVVAKAAFDSPDNARRASTGKIASMVNAGYGAKPVAAPTTSDDPLPQIAVLAFLLWQGNMQVNAFLADRLTNVLPIEHLLYFLWESHSFLGESGRLGDVVFVVDGSEGGSGLLISYLYRLVTGIDPSQIVTLTRGLKKSKARMNALRQQLQDKDVVVLDDCSMTGNQLDELVSYLKNNFKVSRVSAVVSVATAKAKAKLVHNTVSFLVGQEVVDVRQYAAEILAQLPGDHAPLLEAALRENRYSDEVITSTVLPHMVPNNTAKFLHELFTRWLDLPAAHSEKCVVKKAA